MNSFSRDWTGFQLQHVSLFRALSENREHTGVFPFSNWPVKSGCWSVNGSERSSIKHCSVDLMTSSERKWNKAILSKPIDVKGLKCSVTSVKFEETSWLVRGRYRPKPGCVHVNRDIFTENTVWFLIITSSHFYLLETNWHQAINRLNEKLFGDKIPRGFIGKTPDISN